jgi:hypothetical protein
MASVETAAADSRREDLWERLLQYIEDGTVIPVVGQELLTIDKGGIPVPFYDELALRLAERLTVAFPAAAPREPLNWVTSRFLEGGGEPERIYSELQRIVRKLGSLTPSPSLQKLASIEPFRLFVSTTMDSMLAQAINTQRFQGLESTCVVPYSPGNPQDLPKDVEQSGRTFVYQLLGRVSSMQDYVVTEEDALEFLHHLLFSARPTRLFGHIQKRHLLILGCCFPTWIVRFLIRASRESRLLMARGKMDVLVDSGTREDVALVNFLQSYKTRTEVFDTGTAVDFVDELHAQWTARAPQSPRPAAGATAAPFVRPGAVFLSYASEDRGVVEQIRDSLEQAGMDVWFDRHDLEPGDDFERRIRFSIEAASLFMPVLSWSCLKRNRRFLQLEWDYATREARKALASRHFIVPVAIDDLSLSHPDLPEAFGAIHAARLEDGRLPQKAIESILGHYKEFQKRKDGL